jgi:asparagine synthase (glutamine-hydrolysing)
MSIIFGIFDKHGCGIDKSWIETMNNDLSHGSPDRMGIWTNEKTGIGNLLNFNTPESLAEILPLTDPASGLTLCSDSRLDNRNALSELLEISPAEIKSMSDSSLMLKAYQKWGTECTKHLRGDFSFAVYEDNEHRLFLARDHFGIKPLYYCDHHDYFVFSSELRGILVLPFIEKKLNKEWFLDEWEH